MGGTEGNLSAQGKLHVITGDRHRKVFDMESFVSQNAAHPSPFCLKSRQLGRLKMIVKLHFLHSQEGQSLIQEFPMGFLCNPPPRP